MHKPWIIWALLLWAGGGLQAQEYDFLIKGGHLFDPQNGIDTLMDVAIAGDTVARVAPHIPESSASKVIDAMDLWVCPGFIDTHTHVFAGNEVGKFANGINSLAPDNFTFRAGVTTVVDAGTSGANNFEQFKAQVIDPSKTRVLAYLNISATGMVGAPEEEALAHMSAEAAEAMIRKYPEHLVGVKLGHYTGASWAPFDRALAASEAAGVPLFVECHLPQYTLEEQLARMRPGDMITHTYEKVKERASVVDDTGKVRPYVLAARDRGVLFDLGHGGAGFWFSEAVPALEQGLWPNSFGTDLHRFSVNAGMKDFSNVLSKFLALGMPLREVLTRATWYPARALQREDLGHLSVGAVADIAVVKVRAGSFGFVDAGGKRLEGTHKLEAELTFRAGKVVWDLNGLAARPFKP